MEYYEADRAAEEIYARLRAGELPEGVSVAGEEYRYTWTGENLALQVTLRRDEDGWSVLQWQSVPVGDWIPVNEAEVWQGEGAGTNDRLESISGTGGAKGRLGPVHRRRAAAACMKLDGSIRHLDEQRLLPPDTEQIVSEIYAAAGRSMESFRLEGDDDFSFSIAGLARFRVNTYRQRGSMATVIRIVAFDIPDWKTLGIPEQIMSLSELSSGMILVTGVAGSGKSTTQACIIDRINRTRSCHIVTLEDPIEYLHRHQKSIVSQREISIDTEDCLSALRACLRQAPDVILLGEMRDAETIRTAITAAETGHLLIATLHTKGAVNAIDRIIDSFPSGQQGQIRVQLASVLRTVVSQQLLPDENGGMTPVYEVMHVNNRHPQPHSRQQDPPNRQCHCPGRPRGNDLHGPVPAQKLSRWQD